MPGIFLVLLIEYDTGWPVRKPLPAPDCANEYAALKFSSMLVKAIIILLKWSSIICPDHPTPLPRSARQVSIGIDPNAVFKDAEWCLMIGAKPRGPGQERAELLDLNGQIFQAQGRALNESASPNCKVRRHAAPGGNQPSVPLCGSVRLNND